MPALRWPLPAPRRRYRCPDRESVVHPLEPIASLCPRVGFTIGDLPLARRSTGACCRPTADPQPSPREPLLMPEAVRKPFRGPSGRKIDSNGTPHTHQRFAEATTSILLLRANNHFERFHTAWPEAVRKPFCGPSRRKIDSNRTRSTHQRFAEIATSILLLRMINGLQRFHTAWPRSGSSRPSQDQGGRIYKWGAWVLDGCKHCTASPCEAVWIAESQKSMHDSSNGLKIGVRKHDRPDPERENRS